MRQGRLRKRSNHELEYLRQQVIDLEEELEVLRQPDEETSQGLKLSAGETWKCIATKQRGQANAALVENLKLRACWRDRYAWREHWKLQLTSM